MSSVQVVLIRADLSRLLFYVEDSYLRNDKGDYEAGVCDGVKLAMITAGMKLAPDKGVTCYPEALGPAPREVDPKVRELIEELESFC